MHFLQPAPFLFLLVCLWALVSFFVTPVRLVQLPRGVLTTAGVLRFFVVGVFRRGPFCRFCSLFVGVPNRTGLPSLMRSCVGEPSALFTQMLKRRLDRDLCEEGMLFLAQHAPHLTFILSDPHFPLCSPPCRGSVHRPLCVRRP